MIAADANKSNSITTFDIVEFRKLILGIYTKLPNNTSWRFVDKAYNFPNPQNPFQEPFPEDISVANALSNQTDEDFVGVKIGDVNNTVVANSLMHSNDRTTGTLLLDVKDRELTAGEEFVVSFRASEETQGYQLTLNLSGLLVTGLTQEKNIQNVSTNNFGVFEDALTVSIDGSSEFSVKFRTAKSGKLSDMIAVSSRITRAEAYSLTNDRMEVALRFDGKTVTGVGFELYQNQPNPFRDKTLISFHLPEATSATLSVFDETGRVVYSKKGDYPKGLNYEYLELSKGNKSGLLYYSITTADHSATKKMIQVQ